MLYVNYISIKLEKKKQQKKKKKTLLPNKAPFTGVGAYNFNTFLRDTAQPVTEPFTPDLCPDSCPSSESRLCILFASLAHPRGIPAHSRSSMPIGTQLAPEDSQVSTPTLKARVFEQ